MLQTHEDRPHPVPPQAFMTWKENWVFPAVDVDARTAVLFHVSLRPHHGEGIFTAKAQGPDLRIRYVGRSPIPTDITTLDPVADDHLRFEVLEPHRRFRLAYDGDDGSIDAVFTGRFDPFDFADGPKPAGESVLGPIGLSVFPFNHYEQALGFEATMTVADGPRAGVPVELSGFGNRDHSWGWRDDFGFRRHHWVCASFEDRYVQGSAMEEVYYDGGLKHGGFVSTAEGNSAVAHVDTGDTYWEDPPNQPLGGFERDVTYRVTTVDGDEAVVTAHVADSIAKLYLNARSEDRSQVYQDCQIFCEYTDEGNGQRGSGVLELGKFVEGPGIADRLR